MTPDGTPLRSAELADVVGDFERLASLVEETGERVSITAGGELVGVVLPAAELAELEHWAQRGSGAPLPVPDASLESVPGPEQQGPYTRYVHADGLRMTLTRDRVIVAEMRSAGDLAWLEERARQGRQGYMDPKQSAAFAEFLASQPPSVLPKDQSQAPEPRPEEIAVRQVTDAWQRIETWLRVHAPASYASLKPGASQEEINSAERALGVRIPADLKALWALHDGARTVHGEAFLMDNARLMGIAQVVELHGYWGKNYDFRDDPDKPSDLWDHRWIPVCSLGEHSWATGLYLDAGTGELWSWDEHANRQVEYESLTSYLEEMVDALEAPGLFTGARPSRERGALVWRVPDYPDPDHPWVEYTG